LGRSRGVARTALIPGYSMSRLQRECHPLTQVILTRDVATADAGGSDEALAYAPASPVVFIPVRWIQGLSKVTKFTLPHVPVMPPGQAIFV
jgi:hypothetical protein